MNSLSLLSQLFIVNAKEKNSPIRVNDPQQPISNIVHCSLTPSTTIRIHTKFDNIQGAVLTDFLIRPTLSLNLTGTGNFKTSNNLAYPKFQAPNKHISTLYSKSRTSSWGGNIIATIGYSSLETNHFCHIHIHSMVVSSQFSPNLGKINTKHLSTDCTINAEKYSDRSFDVMSEQRAEVQIFFQL